MFSDLNKQANEKKQFKDTMEQNHPDIKNVNDWIRSRMSEKQEDNPKEKRDTN